MDIVERVARAICKGQFGSEDCWNDFIGEAQSALAAAGVSELVEALENASGFLDTPIQRRRNKGSEFYNETIQSARTALSRYRGEA